MEHILFSTIGFVMLILGQIDVTGSIQSILAPAIMISSCGLLLLGLNNRYSAVINRIRLLNNERRKLVELYLSEKHLNFQENVRFKSVQKQLDHLLRRCKLVRNAIISIIVAICLFVLTSLFIALVFFSGFYFFQIIAIAIFILGMFSVFYGVFSTGIEVVLAYKIALIEVKSEE
jgi:O-antigen/teichoic acid export membrane protein